MGRGNALPPLSHAHTRKIMHRPDFDPDTLREHLATLTDAELSRRLDIVQAQIPLAYAKKDTDALARLQTDERLTTEARVNLL